MVNNYRTIFMVKHLLDHVTISQYWIITVLQSYGNLLPLCQFISHVGQGWRPDNKAAAVDLMLVYHIFNVNTSSES